MEAYYNPYNRLQTYLTKLIPENDAEYETAGNTIKNLAESTEIPIEVVRKDLCVLFSYNEYLPFSINEDNEEFDLVDDKYDLSLLMDEDEVGYRSKIQQLILEGKLDEVLFIYADNKRVDYTLPLTPGEYQAYLRLQDHRDKYNYKMPFVVKDSFRFKNNLSFMNILEDLTYAIKNGKAVQLKYKGRGKAAKNRKLEIKPLKIIYDSVDNEYALLTVFKHTPEVFRIGNIINLRIIDKEINLKDKDLKLLDNIRHVWGMEFTGKPVKVRVRFENFAEVWNKVRKNLEYRTEGTVFEQNGYLYYEDIVCGIDAFRSWIYSFGSAAVVEEPEFLRKQIIQSLKDRLQENK